MAVGEFELPRLHPVAGIKVGVAEAGIKYPDRPDVAVFEIAPGSHTAGVFTRNRFCAAPVQVCKQHLQFDYPRYLVVNTGNANAGTGERGLQDALACCEKIAELRGGDKQAVLPFSTGVIGEFLPMDKLLPGIEKAVANCQTDQWPLAAQAILTTDTRSKGASAQFDYQGQTVTVTGIAKGSGMIKPNMATMLAFVATDAAVEQALLQKMLGIVVDKTFNRISVDGDTSTNDCCMLVATGRAFSGDEDGILQNNQSPLYDSLMEALYGVCLQLAQELVKDGEGATKFISVEVAEGKNSEDCLAVAYTIAHSPLVKTALFASDPNWGRILAAVGRAPIESLDIEKVNIYLDDVCIVSRGGVDKNYREAAGEKVMQREEITIRVELGQGQAHETVWTSDLSHDYVKINAEYRT